MPGLNIVSGQEPAAGPPEVSDAPAGSVLAQLRERAAQQRRDQTLDLTVGGRWGDMLIIRYRMPGMEDADRFAAAAARLTEGQAGISRIAVDAMASCCVTVLGKGPDGHVEDLEVTLTGRLLVLLGLPLPTGVDDPSDVTAQEVINAVFDSN